MGLPNRPVALETNEYDIAPAAIPADSNNMTATMRISPQLEPGGVLSSIPAAIGGKFAGKDGCSSTRILRHNQHPKMFVKTIASESRPQHLSDKNCQNPHSLTPH